MRIQCYRSMQPDNQLDSGQAGSNESDSNLPAVWAPDECVSPIAAVSFTVAEPETQGYS